MEKHELVVHFVNRLVLDNRLKPVHISLSLALCHSWIISRFQQPYRISRGELMKASRIRSRATYHKVIRELQGFGYLKYFPSYHPVKASEVELLEESNHEKEEPVIQ